MTRAPSSVRSVSRIRPSLRATIRARDGSPSLAGSVVSLVLVYSAYVAEVYRAGIDSIHESQVAAARSLGLPLVLTGLANIMKETARDTDAVARRLTAGRMHPTTGQLVGQSAVIEAELAKYPDATVLRVETDSDGVYEAHLTTSDGRRVTVEVDIRGRRSHGIVAGIVREALAAGRPLSDLSRVEFSRKGEVKLSTHPPTFTDPVSTSKAGASPPLPR